MQIPLRLFPDESETIEGVGFALRAGKTTCAAVLEHCFHQIDLWDDRVRAWVIVDRAGAMHQARALDAELAAGTCRGPLHGIPIGVKDIIDVEGLPTAAGFKPWRDRVAAQDADIVARLRRAGAVILGKTITTQFAWIDPPVTRNPWNLERTPGGSSSGSAAAVATGMCLGALGTQTGGSIIRPASFCGVAGYKPEKPDISVEGVTPFAPSFDTPGPIARTTRDLILMYGELPNFCDVEQIRAWPRPFAEVENEVRNALTPLEAPPRLVRPRGFFDRRADPVMLDAFEHALTALRAAGAEILDVPDESYDFEGVLTKHRLMMAAEVAAEHESRYRADPGAYAKHIGELVEEGLAVAATSYVRCHQHRNARRQDAGGVLVTPATVGPAPDPTTTGNPCFNAPFTYFWWQVASLPIGLAPDGMPLAIQLTLSHFADVLPIAAWCESVIRRTSTAGSL